jgi:hypothetical protein
VRAVRLDPILFESVRRLLKRRGRVVLFGVREHFPTPEGFEGAADLLLTARGQPAVLLKADD